MLEGVGRQVDGAGAGAVEDGGPVDGHTGDVQLAECGKRRALLVTVLAQQRDQDRVLARTLSRHSAEHTVRAQLHEPRHTLLDQSPHTVVETHRLTHMTHPVT
ncbi:hypothetical protein ABZX04_35805, partial [Streptomyces rochei]